MTARKGIDISGYQTVSDYKKVAQQIDFAILKSGNSDNYTDSKFKRHIEGFIKAGLKHIGIYHFSYAKSVKEAEDEAKFCLKLIEPYKQHVNLPIAFDWEYDSYNYCIKNGVTPTRKLCDDMATAFCRIIEKAGFKSMLYTNPDYLSRFFTQSKYKNLWIAQYSSTLQAKNADVWQYSDKGKINGISGNVDVNYCYNEGYFKLNSKVAIKAKITNKKSVLRSAAHLKGKVLYTLPIGAEVQWLSDDKWGWSKIKYGGKLGYVQNSRLSGVKGLSTYKTAKVKVDGLNVRKAPTLLAKNVIKVLNKGDKFKVICINPDGWIVTNINGKDLYIKNVPGYFKVG